MSQNDKPNLPTGNPNIPAEEILVEENAEQKHSENSASGPQEDESTVGTGTSMALGCIAGTVLLIVFGLIFLAVRTLL